MGKYLPGGSRRYYVKDHLGSVRQMVDHTGAILSFGIDYYPFGLQMPGRSMVSDAPKERFTGHELDDETGLYYAGARYLDPVIGRWMSVDPMADLYPEWSPYNYGLNNPLRFTDPNGMCIGQLPCPKPLRDGIGFAKGYYVGLGKAAYGTGAGLVNAVAHPVQTAEGIAYAVRNYDETFAAIGQGVSETVDVALGNGTPEQIGELTGEAVLGAAATIFGGRVATDVGKARTLTSGLDEVADMSGMLRSAASGKGNFGIGSATRAQADEMGRAWVGEGYTVASDGKTLISADGLRQYRLPTYKPNLDKVQANFEQRLENLRQWQSNAHLDIYD